MACRCGFGFRGRTRDAFAQIALRHGVAVIAGCAHCLDGSGADRLRLSFSQPAAILAEGVRRLKSAWAEYTGAVAGQDQVVAGEVVELSARRRNRAL